jgi:hypothetical protein
MSEAIPTRSILCAAMPVPPATPQMLLDLWQRHRIRRYAAFSSHLDAPVRGLSARQD